MRELRNCKILKIETGPFFTIKSDQSDLSSKFYVHFKDTYGQALELSITNLLFNAFLYDRYMTIWLSDSPQLANEIQRVMCETPLKQLPKAIPNNIGVSNEISTLKYLYNCKISKIDAGPEVVSYTMESNDLDSPSTFFIGFWTHPNETLVPTRYLTAADLLIGAFFHERYVTIRLMDRPGRSDKEILSVECETQPKHLHN